MIKASLDGNLRPSVLYGSNNGFFPIDCNDSWFEAFVSKRLKPRQGVLVGFFDSMKITDYGMVRGIHHGDKTVVSMEIGAINKKMCHRTKVSRLRRLFREPIIFGLL